MSAEKAVELSGVDASSGLCHNCKEYGTGSWTQERDRFVCDSCLFTTRPGPVLFTTRGIFTAMSVLVAVAAALGRW